MQAKSSVISNRGYVDNAAAWSDYGTMPTLVIQLPNMPPVEHVLKEEAMTIGRMNGNAIALDDSSVSLSHAKLTLINGEYHLKDLNSTNGTRLNGQSITEARLRDGDHVKFGEVVARYHVNYAKAASQPTHSFDLAGAAPQVAHSVSVPIPTLPLPAAPAPSSAPSVAIPPPARSAAPSAPVAPRPAPGLKLAGSKPVTAAAPIVPAYTPAMKQRKISIPIIAGAAGAIVVGFVILKFIFTTSSTPSIASQPGTPVAQVPIKSAPPVPPAPSLVPAPSAPALDTTQVPPTVQDIPALIRSLKSNDVTERRHAASSLNGLGFAAKDAIPALRAALKDSDQEVRMWSAFALIHNRIYEKESVPILTQTLQNDDPLLRQMACFSLALIPYEDSEKKPVISALTDSADKDDNSEVRSAAVSALKMIAPEPPTAEK